MKKGIFFQKVGKTRIIPISTKILAVFICLLLLSNFATNYINIQLNQSQVIKLTNQVLVNQLKELYTNSSNQFEIYKFSQDSKSAFSTIEQSVQNSFQYEHSVAFAVKPELKLLFSTGKTVALPYFRDSVAMATLNRNRQNEKTEGTIRFNTDFGEYFGVYKYHSDWDAYLVCAELVADTQKASNKVFLLVSLIIMILTVIFLVIGMSMFTRILRYVKKITDNLYKMQASQSLDLLDLEGAPNDDITYLGASFNSLSSTINNLLGIFQKFVSKDVVNAAYRDHMIKLEGSQKELAVLFTDIRGFTYMTETLGNDIINLLNIHYDRAIHSIHEENGIIGSIIGDALLAVYGAMDNHKNKSLEALESAWRITKVTAELRERMKERRIEIEKEHALTEAEERVFKAVLLDVGVGIDGGTVFYGNIGSSERMTNTVIGDNVNSASRLEGLTRVYKLPVIVSEYVRDDILSVSAKYKFFEIDTVQVKGKTIGKKIFLPLDVETTSETVMRNYEIFELGLKSYYEGDWTQARHLFKTCDLEVSKLFLERISTKKAPADWSGIWTMTTK